MVKRRFKHEQGRLIPRKKYTHPFFKFVRLGVIVIILIFGVILFFIFKRVLEVFQ
ncbi:hypothetical protein JXB22_01950 [candidate division WOR-3 bacterium]|nr:hypothetical protein [candidate division WOR-3 bacterium]